MPPVHAFGVVLGLQQEWRHATHDHRLAHALGTVLSEVACDLAAAHRESDQREILQLQVRDQATGGCYCLGLRNLDGGNPQG